MRLIDADALIEQLRAEGRLTYLVKGAIDNQPTAYDPEKVVAELEEKQYAYIHDNGDYEEGKYYAFEESIDIVKKGGVE